MLFGGDLILCTWGVTTGSKVVGRFHGLRYLTWHEGGLIVAAAGHGQLVLDVRGVGEYRMKVTVSRAL